MTETYNDPAATDEQLQAATDEMLNRIKKAAAQAKDKEAPLREKARALQSYGVDDFSRASYGDGDRFAARFVDEVRCDATGKIREYYFVDEVNRWIKSQKGEMTQRTRLIVDEVDAAARQSFSEAKDESDGQKKDALKKKGLALQEVASRLGSRTGSAAAAANATDTYGMCMIPAETFDLDRRVIACQDQLVILNGSEIEVRAITPEDYITKNTGTAYNPRWLTETPQLMQNYLDNFMPEPEVQRAFFKVMGASLIGFNTYRLLVIILGTTTSGKGQLTDKIGETLSSYSTTANASIFRGNLDERPRADLLNVMKSRVAFLSEASKSWVLHVDRIKDMTGQSKISARALHSNEMLDYVPETTPFLVTNAMPRIGDADAAFARRILVIPFNHTMSVEHEDTSIRERFMEDPDVAEWLLCRMVQGYQRSVEEGIDDVKKLFADATTVALGDVNHLDEALDAMTEGEYMRPAFDEELATTPDSAWITKKEVFAAYTEWVKAQPDKETRDQALGRNNFNKELEQKAGWESVVSNGARWKGWLPGTKPIQSWIENLRV